MWSVQSAGPPSHEDSSTEDASESVDELTLLELEFSVSSRYRRCVDVVLRAPELRDDALRDEMYDCMPVELPIVLSEAMTSGTLFLRASRAALASSRSFCVARIPIGEEGILFVCSEREYC